MTDNSNLQCHEQEKLMGFIHNFPSLSKSKAIIVNILIKNETVLCNYNNS